MTPTAPRPSLLLSVKETNLRRLLEQVFAASGYATTGAASVEQALFLVHRHPFDVILTDLFSPATDLLHSADAETLASLLPLQRLAHGLPIVVLASYLTERDVRQHGFCGVVSLPCGPDDFITTLAECLDHPWTPAERRQAAVARHVLAAFCRNDLETLLARCTEDVRYYPWIVPAYPAARAVTGRAELCSYLWEMQPYFRSSQVELCQVYPCLHGVAARLLVHWVGPAGAAQRQMIGLCLQVTQGSNISQIGMPLQDEQLRTLLGHDPSRVHTRPSEAAS